MGGKSAQREIVSGHRKDIRIAAAEKRKAIKAMKESEKLHKSPVPDRFKGKQHAKLDKTMAKGAEAQRYITDKAKVLRSTARKKIAIRAGGGSLVGAGLATAGLLGASALANRRRDFSQPTPFLEAEVTSLCDPFTGEPVTEKPKLPVTELASRNSQSPAERFVEDAGAVGIGGAAGYGAYRGVQYGIPRIGPGAVNEAATKAAVVEAKREYGNAAQQQRTYRKGFQTNASMGYRRSKFRGEKVVGLPKGEVRVTEPPRLARERPISANKIHPGNAQGPRPVHQSISGSRHAIKGREVGHRMRVAKAGLESAKSGRAAWQNTVRSSAIGAGLVLGGTAAMGLLKKNRDYRAG